MPEILDILTDWQLPLSHNQPIREERTFYVSQWRGPGCTSTLTQFHLSDAILTQQAALERRPEEFHQVPAHLSAQERPQGSHTDTPEPSLHCHQLSTPSNKSYCDWLDNKVNWFLPDQNHGFFLKMSPVASFSRTSSSGAVTGSGSQYPGSPRIPSSSSLRLQLQQNINITNDIKVFSAGSATAGLWVKEWSR